MKGLLAVLLVVSLAANAWLLFGRERPAEEPTSTADAPESAAAADAKSAPSRTGASRRAADAPAATGADELKARIAELEADLATAREKASDAEGLDPLAILIYSKRPIAWKARKLLEIEPEKERWGPMGKLGQVLAEKPESAREVLEALEVEPDPKVVGMLGWFAQSAVTKASVEDRRAFAELLRTSDRPEVRAACVRGVFMSEAFRGGFDDKSKAVAAEMNGVLLDVLRTDSSPEVVGVIASSLAAWHPSAEALDALKSAAARLPPSSGRRNVWEAIARGSFMADQGQSLFTQFEAATAQDVRDDIAAGIARAGNSMGFGGGGTPEQVKKRLDDARARFRTVFQGTSDATVRKALVRGCFHGLGCIPMGTQSDEQRQETVRFFREVAALESDATQRERIEKIASAFEQQKTAWVDPDKILSGKE